MIVFIDTNVWIYAIDESEPEKQIKARNYLAQMDRANTVVLSTQVLQEFFYATTQSGKGLLSPELAIKHMDKMSQMLVMESTAQSVMAATSLMHVHKISWWDSLILEAAIRAKADVLASEDGQAGRKFGKLIVENPFDVKNIKL
jgi:predicted nucleic acid-binding protein